MACACSRRAWASASPARFIGTRYIEAQLFGVTATDPLTFVAGCLALASAGLAAAVIPALRAMRVDPVTALRRT